MFGGRRSRSRSRSRARKADSAGEYTDAAFNRDLDDLKQIISEFNGDKQGDGEMMGGARRSRSRSRSKSRSRSRSKSRKSRSRSKSRKTRSRGGGLLSKLGLRRHKKTTKKTSTKKHVSKKRSSKKTVKRHRGGVEKPGKRTFTVCEVDGHKVSNEDGVYRGEPATAARKALRMLAKSNKKGVGYSVTFVIREMTRGGKFHNKTYKYRGTVSKGDGHVVERKVGNKTVRYTVTKAYNVKRLKM